MVAAVVNGVNVDLDTELRDGDEVRGVHISSAEGLAILRHSAAHVAAQATQKLIPSAKLGIGPPITDGFYYEFDLPESLKPEDLQEIEKQMVLIIKSRQRFRRRVVTREQALAELADEPYKLRLIGADSSTEVLNPDVMEVGGSELTIYDNVDAKTGDTCWSDLCRGPHVPDTSYIPQNAIKVMRSSAAYWLGDQKQESLQRLYGTAWPSKEELRGYLDFLAEAEKRDHRKLGTELDLFSFPEEVGSGLAIFHPKGGIVRRVMEDYSRKRHEEAGYEFVNSPHITKSALFEKSGHLDWYSDGMYPPMHLDAEFHPDGQVKRQGADYYLKPMNCPMHNLIFSARGRSYRELPLRFFEFGTVYRYEKSGVVHGLTRARGFTQDDAHIYCTVEQLPQELDSLLDFVLGLLRDYGLTDFYLELSTKNPDKCVGTNEEWSEATEFLRLAAEKQNLELVLDEGGAAFYGPKISVQARDAIGRTWQMSTIQVDFQLPQRFDLEYQNSDGTKQRPIMVHRALFGSIERFFAVLLEHYAGAFPPWLAPVQVMGIPISDEHVVYLDGVAGQMRARGLRVEVDSSDDRMQKKIRNAQKQKLPFMVIAGDDDVAANAVSFRYRDGTQKNGIPISDAIDEIERAVIDRIQV
ncbi:MAG: threonine--tRNA ligase [Actinobacteria bacterium]|nr:threonine--tRNA ligase [Actinomycetota bacterium]MBT5806536.1 threonine--tRNA ligase [Actinomycetota bacterium]HBK39613.1 threonine--tRNA ligase [Actinomycetota bacterium]